MFRTAVYPDPAGRDRRISADAHQKEIAMLRILLATCETTLDALQAADNPLDESFVDDLKRIVARTRDELSHLGNSR
jgi:hypothetical protein